MGKAGATDSFYTDLPKISAFDSLCDAGCFTPLPDDWLIGVSDVVNSTVEVANGRYKTVNMVGAAVISAQINASDKTAFPFVFGGDGATFAIWPEQAEAAEKALRAVQCWAQEEFQIGLRAGLVPVRDIVAAGLQIGVARYRASEGADYAMFNGGGVSWAENALKSGVYGFDPAPAGTVPDLTGLSCRWTPTSSKNGTILSLVLQPVGGVDDAQFTKVAGDVIQLAKGLERGGHPVPVEGPETQWPPPGVLLEAHASKGTGSLGATRRKILFETLIAWFLFRTGWTIGGFNARHYARITGRNSDFRKYDDGLKMTLDCDAATLAQIRSLLADAQAKGAVEYGLFEQDQAMMTCIVPSILTDDHIHFIDGASGGYTQAATMIKARKKQAV
ncbi:DUF3095 domain-containing protein [uncultured Roseobacter sp.]|uniref:DUF3095 domain-containing protein n=1 Tax=uncultured Roseobacter sp. TaxID=114847 RepID=UPI002624B408|nr:DUF3095 domain-containing protein [uncultured Roseobacter sp.]